MRLFFLLLFFSKVYFFSQLYPHFYFLPIQYAFILCVFAGVVEFLSAGRVSSEHRDFKELGYAGSLRRMAGSEHEFTHNFKLASAYSEDIMPYTNYTSVLPQVLLLIFQHHSIRQSN